MNVIQIYIREMLGMGKVSDIVIQYKIYVSIIIFKPNYYTAV